MIIGKWLEHKCILGMNDSKYHKLNRVKSKKYNIILTFNLEVKYKYIYFD